MNSSITYAACHLRVINHTTVLKNIFYLLRFGYINRRMKGEICSKLTIELPNYQILFWRLYCNFEYI